jgi:hypothetical protein
VQHDVTGAIASNHAPHNVLWILRSDVLRDFNRKVTADVFRHDQYLFL